MVTYIKRNLRILKIKEDLCRILKVSQAGFQLKKKNLRVNMNPKRNRNIFSILMATGMSAMLSAECSQSGHRYHDAGIIYYFDSSGKKVDGNSIPAMCVDNCLKNSKPTITTRGDEQRKVYLYDGIEVVTLMDGTIITVTRKD